MAAILAVKRQSVLDMMAMAYGNVRSLPEFIAANVTGDYDLTAELVNGKPYTYNPEDDVANKKVLRKIEGKIIHTYLNNYNNAEFNYDFNFDFTS